MGIADFFILFGDNSLLTRLNMLMQFVKKLPAESLLIKFSNYLRELLPR